MSKTSSLLDAILFVGKLTHEWNCFGETVKYDMFPIGVQEQIETICSGLDPSARSVVESILCVSHSVRSFGGYDFEDSFENRIKFVRAMQPPVFDLFAEEYRSARISQVELVKTKLDELKKSSPDKT